MAGSAVPRIRLDALLVARGLAASRDRARALILAGQVRVGTLVVSKAGTLVPDDAEIRLATPDHPYVSRGGLKLAHALDTFGTDCRDVVALDVGASTGGFTDVLLRRGARRVVALDVGHNQLDWRLRSDPRVDVREGVNARTLGAADLPDDARTFDLVTIDVSFISLRLIVPALGRWLTPRANVVALVKPQFEVGRAEVGKGGLVTDPAAHARVVDEVSAAARALGFEVAGRCESPVTGAEGNREFLVHLRWRGGPS